MKSDINNRADIEILVQKFYGKVMYDPIIGHFFKEVKQVNWGSHLPMMYSFWENALFFTGGYHGNPMNVHRHLHHLSPSSKVHFDHWTTLFSETVDEMFEGPMAEKAKQHALNISKIMQLKILEKEG